VPGDGVGSDDGGSSENDDTMKAAAGPKGLHMKLQSLMVQDNRNDHFTNALSDPDFALKMKKRAP